MTKSGADAATIRFSRGTFRCKESSFNGTFKLFRFRPTRSLACVRLAPSSEIGAEVGLMKVLFVLFLPIFTWRVFNCVFILTVLLASNYLQKVPFFRCPHSYLPPLEPLEIALLSIIDLCQSEHLAPKSR